MEKEFENIVDDIQYIHDFCISLNFLEEAKWLHMIQILLSMTFEDKSKFQAIIYPMITEYCEEFINRYNQ